MKDIITPFKVGLLVIVGLGAFVWMVGRVEEGIGDDAAGYQVYAMFDDASGLTEKSRVTIAGIDVGELSKIELEGVRAKVWLRVNTPLRADAQISKAQTSLLGEYALKLSPGTAGEPLRDGDEIKNIITDTEISDLLGNVQGLMAEVQKSAENITQITRGLNEVFNGDPSAPADGSKPKAATGDVIQRAAGEAATGTQRLASILRNIDRTLTKLEVAVSTNAPKVDVVVDNVVAISSDAKRLVAEFRRDARQILADTRMITADVRGLVAGNKGEVDKGIKGAISSLEDSLAKLDDALSGAGGTVERANSIAAKLDDGVGTLGRLINDDELIDSVEELVDESGAFVRQITRMQTIVAMRADYYFVRGSVRNALDLKLQPRPDKYYMISLVDDPRGNTSVRETITNTSDSSEDPVIREQQVVTEDRFRLSLQFAKRFYFATGRIGIIENSGGIGLDLHLFDDSLKLSADLFSFDADVWPRLRLDAIYTFFTHVYIAMGVDEVLNEEITDVFLGVGITFNDEDLKALLTTAPVPSL